MTCEQVEPSLVDFHDSSMNCHDADEMKQHLSACSPCRRLAREYCEVRRLAATLPAISPPPAAARRIRAHVEAALRGPNERLADAPDAAPRSLPKAS